MSDPLKFSELRSASVERCEASYGGVDRWSPEGWMTAVTGELGELAGVIKQMMRRGSYSEALVDKLHVPAADVLAEAAAAEAADVVIYLDLLCAKLGIDLGEAVREKFNKVSRERLGSSVLLERGDGGGGIGALHVGAGVVLRGGLDSELAGAHGRVTGLQLDGQAHVRLYAEGEGTRLPWRLYVTCSVADLDPEPIDAEAVERVVKFMGPFGPFTRETEVRGEAAHRPDGYEVAAALRIIADNIDDRTRQNIVAATKEG